MAVVGYTRISTGDQSAELQVRELRAYAENHGWELTELYQDVMSGAESSRPGLKRLMADACDRKLDCILVWKLDRFGRSLVDCLNNIRVLEENGVRFIAVTQALDTDVKNPASRFLLHVLGAAAEFERSLILERTQAGRLRYQQDHAAGRVGKGVYSRSGRNLPPYRPRRIFDREQVAELRHAKRPNIRPPVRNRRRTGLPTSRTRRGRVKSTFRPFPSRAAAFGFPRMEANMRNGARTAASSSTCRRITSCWQSA